MIGRSPYADVVIADPTVAEFHAEIVMADGDRVFVCDCGSPIGTRRLVDSGGVSIWVSLRQGFVQTGDTLRLGDYECMVADLLAAAAPEIQPARQGAAKVPPRPAGRLSRDPWTGEIVRRGR